MKRGRRHGWSAQNSRLQRHIELSLSPDRPRRLRTRSARYAAALAEQLGMLERPAVCTWCRGRRRLHRHHWDYDEPLNVTFLCTDCHTIADSMAAGWHTIAAHSHNHSAWRIDYAEVRPRLGGTA